MMRSVFLGLAAALALAARASADPTPAVSPGPPPVPHVVIRPTWRALPTGDDMSRFYPQHAQRLGLGGLVRLRCVVTAGGDLVNCQVLDETPPDEKFGEAALKLAELFKANPRTVDGTPVGGAVIIIPIRFQLPQ